MAFLLPDYQMGEFLQVCSVRIKPHGYLVGSVVEFYIGDSVDFHHCGLEGRGPGGIVFASKRYHGRSTFQVRDLRVAIPKRAVYDSDVSVVVGCN